MERLTPSEIGDYVENNITDFHQRRLQSLLDLRLERVLQRKNPYLFKAKNISLAPELVKAVLDAHLSSQEEGIFGGFLEGLAIFTCSRSFNGRKSSAEGIDLEFERDRVLYIVTIKSGPNWGNAQQIARMIDNFRKAKRILRTNAPARSVTAVNGCCYGRQRNKDRGDYLKLCGQDFWEFISGNDHLYTDIIEPLGHRARERNEQFQSEYGKVINRFTKEFVDNFCEPDGAILWEKLVRFNSGRKDR